MADKIVSWGGFDSKGTSGMGVTGSLSISSGSIAVSGPNSMSFSYTINDTSPTFIKMTNGGGGINTGGTIAFPYGTITGNFGGLTLTNSGGSTYSLGLGVGGDLNWTGANFNLQTSGNSSINSNGISGTSMTFKSGGSFVFNSFSGGFRDVIKFSQAGNLQVGGFTDAARLEVKGSGTTSSTTSFLVQNANATASLTIKDDLSITAAGSIILQQPGSSNTITINPTGSNFLKYYQAGAFDGNLMTFSAGTITFPNSVNFTNGLASSNIITTNNIGVDNSNTNRFIRFWKSGFATRVTITHTDAGTLQFRVFDSYDDTTGGVGMYITQQGNAGLTGSLTVGSLSNLSEDQRMSITNPGTYYGDMFGLTLPSSFDPGVMHQTRQGGSNWNGQIASGSNIITSYPAGGNYNPNYASYISVGDYVRDANSGFRARVLTVSATTMSLDRNIAVSYTGSNFTFWPRAYGHTAGTLVYNTTTNKVNYWTTSSLNILLDSSGSQAITGSLTITGSATISNVLTLTPQTPLPSGVPTGSFAVSSSVPPKPYFYDGTAWNALY